MKQDSIHITIVDDHPMLISGLTAILQPYGHIRIMDTFTTAPGLLEGLKQRLPDVLLLDLLLPGYPGKELVPVILEAYPELKILVLTSIDLPAMVHSMMRRGCLGYLLKGARPEMLIDAIESVHKGVKYIDPSLKEQWEQNLTSYQSQADPHGLPTLSHREKEVLRLIANEYTTKEIAEQLFISYRTAENHRCNLIQKLDVKNTAGLVRIAIQMGLI